jgi:hypothetical protein
MNQRSRLDRKLTTQFAGDSGMAKMINMQFIYYPLISLTLGGNTSFGLSVAPSANSSFMALMVAGIPFS